MRLPDPLPLWCDMLIPSFPIGLIVRPGARCKPAPQGAETETTPYRCITLFRVRALGKNRKYFATAYAGVTATPVFPADSGTRRDALLPALNDLLVLSQAAVQGA